MITNLLIHRHLINLLLLLLNCLPILKIINSSLLLLLEMTSLHVCLWWLIPFISIYRGDNPSTHKTRFKRHLIRNGIIIIILRQSLLSCDRHTRACRRSKCVIVVFVIWALFILEFTLDNCIQHNLSRFFSVCRHLLRLFLGGAIIRC